MQHTTSSHKPSKKTIAIPLQQSNSSKPAEDVIHRADIYHAKDMSPDAILQLQRIHGNQYVQRLLRQPALDMPLSELANTDYPALSPEDTSASPSTDMVIQRAWDTNPLEYGVMDNEKTQGQIRTNKLKYNSIKDWVKKFHKAVTERKEKDVLSALTGLKSRLTDDQDAAAKGKLKSPKGVKNKDFDFGAAQLAAATFFNKWIQAVDDHIVYIGTQGDWITDFRQKYIFDATAVGLTPKQIVLANVAKIEDADDSDVEAVGEMWDLGDAGMKQRMVDIMGGVSELSRMSRMEYFLEQVSPVHSGYSTVRAIFDMWKMGVLYHGWTHRWEVWMITKTGQDFEGKKERIIDSYDAVTRAQYKLTPTGKTIMKANGAPLVGDNIYVLTEDNEWYGGTKDGPVHHSSFMQGAPVKCAGHLHTDGSGNLQRIDRNSGHYAPEADAMKRAIAVLSKQMDISDVETGAF